VTEQAAVSVTGSWGYIVVNVYATDDASGLEYGSITVSSPNSADLTTSFIYPM
jgi:hypothetical protein